MGPTGFDQIFGVNLNDRGADWGEAVPRGWTKHWADIAAATGVPWEFLPHDPGDFENALCIYHETHKR